MFRKSRQLNNFNLKYLEHIVNPVPSWEFLHTHILMLYCTSILKVKVRHNLSKQMADTLQLLPTERSSLSIKLVARTMFTHFEFSTKAISKALTQSNKNINMDCAWACCTEAQDDIRSLTWGEKSSLEERTAMLCFWQGDPHLYLSDTRLSWLSHLELQYFTVHRTIS